MDGALLKKKLLELDTSLANVALKLNMKPQALNQALKAADIKTGFIENIAKTYGRPINFFFEEQTLEGVSIQASNGSAASFAGDALISNGCDVISMQKEIECLNREIEHYKARLEEKERLIKVLMEK